MRFTKLLIALLLLISPAFATWTARGGTTGVIGTNAACAAATSCNVTVTATTAGDVLVATALFGCTANRTVTGSLGGTWVAGTAVFSSTASGCAGQTYTLAASGGTTSLTVTLGAASTGTWAIEVRALTSSAGGVAAETVPAGTTSAGCSNNCVTPTVTLAGTADALVAAIFTQQTGCSVAAPYGQFTAPGGDGVAINLNTASGTGATFTQGSSCPTAASGGAAMVTIAFKETASSTKLCTMTLLGAGPC